MAISAFLLDLFVIAVLLLIGILFTRFISRSFEYSALLSLAFPLGTGLLTWIILILWWLGIPDLRVTSVVVSLILIIGLWAAGGIGISKPKWAPTSILSKIQSEDLVSKVFIILISTSVLFAFVISVGRSYSVWDAIAAYSVKGYGIALENSIDGARIWGSQGFEYPPNIPLLISFFRMMSGDLLPGSKLLFPFYLISILIASYRFWRLFAVKKIYSLLGVGLLATVPILFEHATTGFANLPLAAYLTLAVVWGIEGIYTREPRAQIVSSLLFGFACWIRPEGILYSLTAMFSILLISRIMKQGLIDFRRFTIPFFIIGATWMIFYIMNGGSESQAMGGVSAALINFSNGNFDVDQLLRIIRFAGRSILRIEVWGMLFVISAILIARWLLCKNKENSEILITAVVASFSLGAVSLLLFYLGQFDREADQFIGWLQSGFARTFIPFGVMIGISAILSTTCTVVNEKY